IALDVAPSIINTEKASLSQSEKEALESFDKMNILAFKANDKNNEVYKKEIAEVKGILKDESYQQLMKVGSGSDGAAVFFFCEDEQI
ncbi:MAG: DUF4252 domain-containing protein, partial [Flavobacterium sp.]